MCCEYIWSTFSSKNLGGLSVLDRPAKFAKPTWLPSASSLSQITVTHTPVSAAPTSQPSPSLTSVFSLSVSDPSIPSAFNPSNTHIHTRALQTAWTSEPLVLYWTTITMPWTSWRDACWSTWLFGSWRLHSRYRSSQSITHIKTKCIVWSKNQGISVVCHIIICVLHATAVSSGPHPLLCGAARSR